MLLVVEQQTSLQHNDSNIHQIHLPCTQGLPQSKTQGLLVPVEVKADAVVATRGICCLATTQALMSHITIGHCTGLSVEHTTIPYDLQDSHPARESC